MEGTENEWLERLGVNETEEGEVELDSIESESESENELNLASNEEGFLESEGEKEITEEIENKKYLIHGLPWKLTSHIRTDLPAS